MLHAQNWNPVGSGMDNGVWALFNDTVADLLYVGGSFTSAGGIQANHIASWDGTSWQSLGTGLDDAVSCIAFYNGELYVGGTFDNAGVDPVNNIARWDGAGWQAVGNGTDAWIKSLAVYNNELYAAGFFTVAGGWSVNGIAKWDGVSWWPVGQGLNDYVNVLQVFDGKLYAGGGFTEADGQPAYYIASWDGTNWSAVGNGLSDDVRSMTIFNSNLYVSYDLNIAIWDGTFLTAWGNAVSYGPIFANYNALFSTTAYSVSKWDQLNWSALGSPMNTNILVLQDYHNELYAGGFFDSVGTTEVNYLARWDLTTSDELFIESNSNNLSFFPNPFTEYATVRFRATESGHVKLKIYNNLNQTVGILIDQLVQSGQEFEIPVNETELPPGIYHLVFENHRESVAKKIIKLR